MEKREKSGSEYIDFQPRATPAIAVSAADCELLRIASIPHSVPEWFRA